MREGNLRGRPEELDGAEAETSVREDPFTRRFNELRQELMPYAEALGIYTDADVVRAAAADRRSGRS